MTEAASTQEVAAQELADGIAPEVSDDAQSADDDATAEAPATPATSDGDGDAPSHPGRKWIKNSRLVMASVLTLMGALIIPEGIRLKFMVTVVDGTQAPGSGFFPILVGSLLVACAIPWGIIELRTPTSKQIEQDIDPKGHWRVINVAVTTIALAYLFIPLGVTLTTLIYLLYTTFFMQHGPDRTKWWLKVGFSVVIPVALKLGFRALGVTLPACPIPFLRAIGL